MDQKLEDGSGYIVRPRLKGKEEKKRKEQKGEVEREGGEGPVLQAETGKGDPGSALVKQQLFRQTWKGRGQKGEEEEQEGNTPELPDQVIAVRCQSAAERGRGERRDMRHQSRMGQRENVSQEPTPAPRFLVA